MSHLRWWCCVALPCLMHLKYAIMFNPRVAAGFSLFPENIPKPFHHVYTVCRYQIMHILYKFIHTHIHVDTVHVHVHVG